MPMPWHQVRALFEQVCELDPKERKSELAKRCEDDPDLRAEVESLLAASDAAPPFFETSPGAMTGECLIGRHVAVTGLTHVSPRVGWGRSTRPRVRTITTTRRWR